MKKAKQKLRKLLEEGREVVIVRGFEGGKHSDRNKKIK